MSYSQHDVRAILSQDHLRNTANYLQKSEGEVTGDDLIQHWERHHVAMMIHAFTVEPIAPCGACGQPFGSCVHTH